MKQGTILGSQMGRWMILAALVVALGALLLTIRPVGAQNLVTHSGTVKEHSTDVVRLGALEPDQTQVSDRWELVTDVADPAGDPGTDFPDYRLFKIDRMTGVLSFKSPPDYENPKSAAAASAPNLAAKNVYRVKAKFGDGEKYLAVEVTVRVTGIEEDGDITLSNRRPQVGVGLTATLADPDKGIRTPDWQWQVETGEGTGVFQNIPNAVNRTYTPRTGDVGKHLKATANYQDGHDTDYIKEEAVSELVVRAAPGSNKDPKFREEDENTTATGIQTSRRIEENAAPGTKVGPALKATDDDHLPAGNPGGEPRDEITYSLRDPAAGITGNTAATDDDNDPNTPSDRDGHAALFSIDQVTGQITTNVSLDHESLDRDGDDNDYIYTVMVKATDPSGAEGEATLTIHVLDEEETPQLMGPAALTYFENTYVDPNASPLVHQLVLDRDLDTTGVQQALYRANDNDLDNDGSGISDNTLIQWELTGPDAAMFQFGTAQPVTYTNSTAITGASTTAVAVATAPALQFRRAPNVEAPADVGGTRGDNVYEITVRAWDEDWLIGSRDVTIRVADTDDPGTVTLSHTRPQQGVAITATLDDPDGISGAVSWQWYTGTGTDSPIAGATKASFTPTTSDISLTVQATYEDRGSRGQERTATKTTANTVRQDPIDDPTGENANPTFYGDVNTADGTPIDLSQSDERIKANETSTYTRYLLEGKHPRNVRNTELAAREYADTDDTVDAAAAVKVWDGFYADAAAKTAGTLSNDGDNGENLQFDLSGADAKHFEINQNPGDTSDPAGLIKTKGALDFETKSTYTVKVTATDPHGGAATVTVTIKVLDQAEIEGVPGDEKRVWVDEAVDPTAIVKVDDLRANNPPDISLGGLKWSLLTTNEAYDPSSNPHNRNDVRSVDCQADTANERLCDDFRFSNFNTANTQLLFAIGTGEDHDPPDFEDPQDIAGAAGSSTYGTQLQTTAPDQAAGDNIYQVRVRVAFATLRSDGELGHPSPEPDEMEERTFVVRVVDVDEAPSFRGADSAQSIDENSDDDLPGITINTDLGGSVTATDPEDTTPDPDRKLTFSLSVPQAYADMFQIVPSTGEILTRSRIDYEALDLVEQGIPGGQYKSITGVTITVVDSSGKTANTATLPVTINVRDVNETPRQAQPLVLGVTGAIADYAEDRTDTSVGTLRVTGDNAAAAAWTLGGADADQFMLDPATGTARMLKFKEAPDFEMPRGQEPSATNTNAYAVTVTVAASGETAMRSFTVNVTNAEEAGTVTLDKTHPSVGTMITATLADPDGTITDLTWVWARADSADAEDFTAIPGATSASYTPVAVVDTGKHLRATASYTDAAGTDTDTAMSNVIGPVTVNQPPAFAAETATRSIAENTSAGVNIGAPVTASDPDRDTLTYSLEGTDAASFSIVAATGQLQTSASLDYETKSTYSVVVKATDTGNLTDTIAVTINVIDVNEGLVAKYDTDKDGAISALELFGALADYLAGTITVEELFVVLAAHLS